MKTIHPDQIQTRAYYAILPDTHHPEALLDFFIALRAKAQKQKNKAGRIIKEPIRIINHLGPACPATPQTGFFGFIAYSQSKGNFSFAPIRSGLHLG